MKFIFVLIFLLVLCLVYSTSKTVESFEGNPFEGTSNVFDIGFKNIVVAIDGEMKKTKSTDPNINIKMALDHFNASSLKSLLDPLNSIYTNGSFDYGADAIFKILNPNNKATLYIILYNTIELLLKLLKKCTVPPPGTPPPPPPPAKK